jgi:hypothetical protein
MPVIVSNALFDKSVQSGCGTFIVLNKDGWVLTAAHIVAQLALRQQHQQIVTQYEELHTKIINNPNLRRKIRENQLRNLKPNPQWIINQAMFWGWATCTIKNFLIKPSCDLAAGKLEPFDPDWVKSYPVFKNPKEPMLIGTSLCRLGYPLYDIKATFDNGVFNFAEGVLPIPRFPNDGIFTRNVNFVSPDKTQTARFLETSSPGLRGQSGGPIFDKQGHVWALQSQTQSLPLGFTPSVMEGNKKIVEHQFIHVGWGVHVAEIVSFLNEAKISFNLSS